MADLPETIPLGAPWTREEILVEHGRAVAAADAYWNAIPAGEFFAPLGAAWSPADNVRHLVKSIRPVTFALRLPHPALRLAFGRARRPSRTLAELRRDYLAALARGGQAGRFAPRPRPIPDDPESARRELMRERAAAEAALARAIGHWRDADLDSHRLPHPLLGPLTVREMVFFTIYHDTHHVDVVARRRAARGGA